MDLWLSQTDHVKKLRLKRDHGSTVEEILVVSCIYIYIYSIYVRFTLGAGF